MLFEKLPLWSRVRVFLYQNQTDDVIPLGLRKHFISYTQVASRIHNFSIIFSKTKLSIQTSWWLWMCSSYRSLSIYTDQIAGWLVTSAWFFELYWSTAWEKVCLSLFSDFFFHISWGMSSCSSLIRICSKRAVRLRFDCWSQLATRYTQTNQISLKFRSSVVWYHWNGSWV